jgi:hypothetical protein
MSGSLEEGEAASASRGGLGIMDFNLLGCTLRLKWLWLSRTDHGRPWALHPVTDDAETQAFFQASITCVVRDGKSMWFWMDPWLDGRRIGDLMPELLEVVQPRARRRRSVAVTLAGHAWIRDVVGALTIPVFMQYLQLCQRVEQVSLSQGVEDRIIWKWTASRQYSSSSAYTAMFLGQSALLGAKELWKVRAPNEFKFFLWLAMQDRCWSSERLARHGLQNNGLCALCDQQVESIDHLLVGCAFSREVWMRGFQPCGWALLTPRADDVLTEWWLRSGKLVTKPRRPAFDSVCFLIARSLWLERNARVYNNKSRSTSLLSKAIAELVELWFRASVE